ncbi:MAG: quinolinate synthase NadA, partial [Clostridiales bacterium]|nr:quinolinate synthase NadA [Clostridiales bacterium]
MTIQEMQKQILQYKRERDILILAHCYERREITEIADFTGDSYALALQATRAKQQTVIMCGVRFMAETVKILSPEKKVYLSNADAGCPMAEQLDLEELSSLKEQYPNAVTAAYINTTASLKTLCDVCVTSSSAERILRALPEKEILFVPDINLGRYLAERMPEKQFRFVHGGCPTHVRANKKDVERAKSLHPDALFLAHPECLPEVVALADYVG